ncbi:MAG: hypothetical protein RIT20_968, partial [Pseudomonadota bacterium]
MVQIKSQKIAATLLLLGLVGGLGMGGS